MAPPIGLVGSEAALVQGRAGALGALNAGNQGIDIQAALAGLSGNNAQRTAFENFQASPGQEYLQDQGRIGVLRGASATGGLGGGNVQRELISQRMGLAAQDFNNQFQRGQQVLGSQQALAPAAASVFQNAGAGIARDRFNTGTALSGLIDRQGSGASDIIGRATGNAGTLLAGSGLAQGSAQEQLATLLGNLALQQGSTAAGAPSAAKLLDISGYIDEIGQVASGAGGLLTGFG